MNHDDILRRIKKLLAVTTERGASDAEAEQAARRVRQLLDEHNFSMLDIQDKEEQLVEEGVYQPAGRKWTVSVAYAVGKLYDCQIAKSSRSFAFIGARLDIHVCQEVFRSLLMQIQHRAVRYHGTANHDYRQGIAIGLKDRIFAIIKDRQVQTEQITALVVQKQNAIDQWVKQQGFIKTTRSSMRYRPSTAFMQGVSDAKSLQIRTSIN